MSKYDGFFATVVSAAVTGPTGGVAGLAAGKLMFHGTPARFDRVESRPSTRTSSGGKIDWQGEAIFAAFDPRIALFYTATRGTGVGTSVNLREITSPDQPLDIHLDGGANQAEALDLAYGRAGEESSRGYIHVLERSKFVREPGLGVMELITRDSDAQIGRLEIDRRKALDSLVASGDVNVRWSAE